MDEKAAGLYLPATPYQVEPDIAEMVQQQLRRRSRMSVRHPVVVMESRAIRRFLLEATADGHRFLSDEPIDGGGYDTAVAPLRYFVAGVVLCLEVWCIKMAAVMGIQLGQLSSRAEAFLDSQPSSGDAVVRGFDMLTVALYFQTVGPAEPEQIHEMVRQVIANCPATVTFCKAAHLQIEIFDHEASLGVIKG